MYVQLPGDAEATKFALAKLHFHYESEHRVNGERSPLELHIVHKVTEPIHSERKVRFAKSMRFLESWLKVAVRKEIAT